jgi:hypothetical protein
MRVERYIPALLVAITAAAALFAIATARASNGAEYKGWQVEVSVTPQRLGPIALDVRRVHEIGGDLSASLVFRNHAKTKAKMVDTFRSAAFAEGGTGRQLFVADEGCHWSPGASGSLGACQEYLDFVEIDPGRTGLRVLTAVAGEPQMEALTAGHYEYLRPVRFGFPKGKRPPVRADLVVSYDVTPR